MIDHHTLLVVAGFALGSIVHQAVSHYNVPVLMLARAAVAKAQRTIVEAFEGDLSEDCPSDAEDASYAEGPMQHADIHPLTLALTRPSNSQVLIRSPQTSKPPISKTNVPKTLQLRVVTFAGVPAVYLSHNSSWITPVHQPAGSSAVLRDITHRLEGPSSAAGSAAARLAKQQAAGGSFWGAVRFSTVGVIAAAAVIGVSCIWCNVNAGFAQHHSSSNCDSGVDTTAVLRTVTSIRGENSSSTPAVSTLLSGQLSIYLPQKLPKHIPDAVLKHKLVAVDTPGLATASPTTAGTSPIADISTEAHLQLQRFKQQHLGIALHHQGQLDRDVSMLQGALGSGSQRGSSTGNCGVQRADLAAWSDLMEQWESGEVQLAEALAERSLGASWVSGAFG